MKTLLAGYGQHQEKRVFVSVQAADGQDYYLIQDEVDERFYANSVGDVPTRVNFSFPYWLNTYVEDVGCHTYYEHRVITESDLNELGLQMAWAIHHIPEGITVDASV